MCQYGLCAACDFGFGFGLGQASAQQMQLQAWPTVEIQGKASENICMRLCLFLQESDEFMNAY